jgi:DNA-3-methyladenine glycosylase
MNVVTREEGIAEAVLIRALEPLEGLDIMSENRFKKEYKHLKKAEIKNLTNGPSKLCNALGINRECNGMDLCGDTLYIEEGEKEAFNIKEAKRIGIDYAEEAKDYLWRFYIDKNKYVSKL